MGLEVKAINDGEGGEGYIVIKVPGSRTPPHGFGRPAKTYHRVNDRSEPMTMRDMQNAFWDGRMRRERIVSLRQDKRASFEDLGVPEQHFAYRMSLIANQNIYADQLLERL